MKIDKIHYSRNFKLALIASLIVVIVMFTFIPDINLNISHSKDAQTIFTSSDIAPPTVQHQTESSKSAAKKPPTPRIVISTEVGEPELLEDVKISNENKGEKSLGTGNIASNGKSTSSNPSMPRQILEVLPEKGNDNFKGRIDLSLNIGNDGKVIGYKVIDNTTGSTQCLKNVLKAVYKSRWEPLSAKDDTTSYWLHKSYTFN